MSQFEQLVDYVRHQLQLGNSAADVRKLLLQHNWDINIINQALMTVQGQVSPTYPQPGAPTPQITEGASKKRHKNGVLWILSPFIVFTGVIVLQVIARFAGIDSPAISIFSVLGGLAGMILFFVGPIVGIVKLIKK